MVIHKSDILETKLKTYISTGLGMSELEFSKNYHTKAIHLGMIAETHDSESAKGVINFFALEVPDDAIKVVDFKIQFSDRYIHLYGLGIYLGNKKHG
ncbi:MAG: hypothetical protein ACP5NV_02055 [Candidatus Woesearchaeota archaeon]